MKKLKEKDRERLNDEVQSQELPEEFDSQLVTDERTPYDEAVWRNRTVDVPGQNPFNGKTYGDVMDLVSSSYW